MLSLADELRLRGVCGEDIRPAAVVQNIRELTGVDITTDGGARQVDMHLYLGELLLKRNTR
jgi:hypothetical protein